MQTSWNGLETLVLVPGHAVYLGGGSDSATTDGRWVLNNFQSREPRRYIEQIRAAVELVAAQPDALLVFSGGQTRIEAGPRSESQGYWLVAEYFRWWDHPSVPRRATTEEFARDSFENLLFGIARFRESTNRYPRSIDVVGWRFKKNRFDFHRQTIRWPSERRFEYHGVNDPEDIDVYQTGEAKTLAAFHRDPFGSEGELSEKRRRRNPFLRQHPYRASCPDLAQLLSHQTADGARFTGEPPWGTAE